MKKLVFFIALLLCASTTYSQEILPYSKTKTCRIIHTDIRKTVEKNIVNSLENNPSVITWSPKRDPVLDSIASIRGEYFWLLLHYTMMARNVNYSEAYSHIDTSNGFKNAHCRSFNNPSYFLEPKNVPFFEIYSDEGRKHFRYEIHSSTSKYYVSSTRMTFNSLFNVITYNLIMKKCKFPFLQDYLNSPSHKKAVTDTKNKTYGLFVAGLIIESIENKTYNYEVIIFNLIVINQKEKQMPAENNIAF